MRKWVCMLLLALFLLPAAAFAQEGETVSAYGRTFDKDTTEISMGSTRITNVNKLIEFMKQFPNLEKIELLKSTFKVSEYEKILAQFPGVHVDCQLFMADHRVRTDATSFSTWHSQYPEKSPHHRSKSFEALKYCYNMQALDLGHNDITDISFIAHMTDLRILILADNDVTDISVLRNMKNLQYAELFMNKISDLTPLEDLPLLDVNLAYNAVSDWSPLEKIETLERAWLYASGKKAEKKQMTVPDDVLASLMAANPDLVYDNKSGGSTGGGWRYHPRYEVVYNSFRSGNVAVLKPLAEMEAETETETK